MHELLCNYKKKDECLKDRKCSSKIVVYQASILSMESRIMKIEYT